MNGKISTNNLITNSTFLESCVHSCDFSAAVLEATIFVALWLCLSLWLPAFGCRVCPRMAMSAAGASNHQDYRRSPSDYSKLAFPSYSWPRLDSLVLIRLTATSTPRCPPQTSLIFCQMQVSMIPMVKALLQRNILCIETSLYTVSFPDRIAEGLHFVLIY